MLALAAILLLSCRPGDAPSDAWLRGLNAVADGRYDLARDALGRVAAERPDDAEACTLWARSWSRGTMQSPRRAIEAWQKCAVLEPSDEGLVEIARAHLRLGAPDETLTALEGVAPTAEVYRLRGEALLRLDPAAAVAEMGPALEGFPHDAELLALAGRAAELKGDSALALERVSRALRLNPLDDRMLYLRARLLQALDRPDASEAAFARYELVCRLRGLGGRIEPTAIEQLRLLDELDVKTTAARVRRIELLAAVGRRTEAAEAIDDLASEGDADPALLLRAEEVAVALGRSEAAHRLLDLVGASGAEGTKRREVLYRRARLLRLAGDTDGALREVASVLAEEPWLARFLDLQGRLQVDAGDEPAAERSFFRALDLAPWRADTRLALCELELRRAGRDRVRRLLDGAPEPSLVLDAFRRRHGLS